MLTVLHDHFELIDSCDAFHLKELPGQIGQFVYKFRHFDGLVQTVFLNGTFRQCYAPFSWNTREWHVAHA